MKTIIAGSRGFTDYDLLKETCDQHIITEVVSGGARGADRLGERYADEKHIPKKIFPAKWNFYGKSAGYMRNVEMADYAEALIAFWDEISPGTKHMIELARKYDLEVTVITY